MAETALDWNPEDLQRLNISKMIPDPPKSPNWEKLIENLDRDLAKQRALSSQQMVPNFCEQGPSHQNGIDVAGIFNRTSDAHEYTDVDSTLNSKRVDNTNWNDPSKMDIDNKSRWNDPSQMEIDNTSIRMTPLKEPMDIELAMAPRKPPTHRPMPRVQIKPRTLFTQNNAAEKKHAIGNNKFVSVSRFRNRKTVHIRTYFQDAKNITRPTKRGIVLTPEEWRRVTRIIKDVDIELLKP